MRLKKSTAVPHSLNLNIATLDIWHTECLLFSTLLSTLQTSAAVCL